MYRKTSRIWFVIGIAVLSICCAVAGASKSEDLGGKELFVRRCSGCHAPDIDKEGPRLRGVYGRKAASVPTFPYSEQLKQKSVTWDDFNLDRWLKDPDAMVPDTDMAFRVPNADERKALILYLKTLKSN